METPIKIKHILWFVAFIYVGLVVWGAWLQGFDAGKKSQQATIQGLQEDKASCARVEAMQIDTFCNKYWPY